MSVSNLVCLSYNITVLSHLQYWLKFRKETGEDKFISVQHTLCVNAYTCPHELTQSAQLPSKPTNVQILMPACTQHTYMAIQQRVQHTETTVNGVMVFGYSWNRKWMLLCFQLIVLPYFGHGSLFMAITLGEVWFINASSLDRSCSCSSPCQLCDLDYRPLYQKVQEQNVCCCAVIRHT